jgi:hypothetical protein
VFIFRQEKQETFVLKIFGGDVMNEVSIISKSNQVTNSGSLKQFELGDFKQSILSQAAENIRLSEKLRREINMDISKGVTIYKILDKTLLCISLMTMDKPFYEANSRKLQEKEKK